MSPAVCRVETNMVEGLNTELQQFSDLRDSTSIKSAAVTVDSNSQTDSSVKNKQKKTLPNCHFLSLTDATYTQVLSLRIISMCCFIALATQQVFYLRQFLKKKEVDWVKKFIKHNLRNILWSSSLKLCLYSFLGLFQKDFRDKLTNSSI